MSDKLTKEIEKSKIVDLTFISQNKEYSQYKSEPPKKWFNTTVCILISIIGVCVGIGIAQIIYHVCK